MLWTRIQAGITYNTTCHLLKREFADKIRRAGPCCMTWCSHELFSKTTKSIYHAPVRPLTITKLPLQNQGRHPADGDTQDRTFCTALSHKAKPIVKLRLRNLSGPAYTKEDARPAGPFKPGSHGQAGVMARANRGRTDPAHRQDSHIMGHDHHVARTAPESESAWFLSICD